MSNKAKKKRFGKLSFENPVFSRK